jgi:hypothetical protein
LISSPPSSFDIFDDFNFFDLDISSSGITLLKIQRLTARRFGVRLALPRAGEAMLKISFVDNDRQRRVIVEGKLIAPWAAELRSACQEARADLRGRDLVIEMKHITTISQEGENIITELINGGTRFRCHGVFTKHVVKELTRRASRNLRIRASD